MITLIIVFVAFIISPMTECLGPVLELNVSQLRTIHEIFLKGWRIFVNNHENWFEINFNTIFHNRIIL